MSKQFGLESKYESERQKLIKEFKSLFKNREKLITCQRNHLMPVFNP